MFRWFLIVGFLFVTLSAQAEVKTFTQTAEAFIGDNQTKNDARQLALLEAKRLALEQAGTFVSSLTVVKEAVVVSDQILAFTAGLAEAKVLKEDFFVEGESFGARVTAEVQVDTSVLEKELEHYRKNQGALDSQQALLDENKRLEDELKKLRSELAAAQSEQQVKTLNETLDKEVFQKIERNAKVQDVLLSLKRLPPHKAMAKVEKYLAAHPEDGRAYFVRAILYAKTRRCGLALNDFQKACQLGVEKACSIQDCRPPKRRNKHPKGKR